MMFQRQIREGQDYKLSSAPEGAHAKIISHIGAAGKILDVGCGLGYLGQICVKKGCYVVGIEPDAKRAEEARRAVNKVITGNVEDIDSFGLEKDFFDAIILADVLEHSARPDIVLVTLKKYLKDGGRIIVSVPNIARVDSRIKLLLGKFEYEDGGIFDKTHLRFFTGRSILKLLTQCGYEIKHRDYSGVVSRFGFLKFMAGLLAFQIIIVAEKKSAARS